MSLIDQSSEKFLGIDIGASSIKYGWGNPSVGIDYFDSENLEERSRAGIISAISIVLQKCQHSIGLDKIKSIGAGTPGKLNKNTHKLVGINPNLSDWTEIDPIIAFPERLREKVVIDNDANLMTLAEAKLLPEANAVLGITIGSGIGCGFVLEGRIYHGAHGFAMELGHNIVCASGEKCNCGKAGCLEAYASVTGMLQAANKKIGVSDISIVDFLKASESNQSLHNILDDSLQYLSLAASNLVINLDADAIVIGGGVTEIGEYPLKRLMNLLYQHLPVDNRDSIVIKKAHWGNKAGVMGGILLASDFYSLRNRNCNQI